MFGRLLMDKRLHRFMKGFAFPRRSLHAHVSRFYVVGPPRLPPVFNVVVCVAIVFCFPCLSLLVASWNRSPILNPEGRGEVCVLCFFFVAVPLVYFSGAIFCPSTVKMLCFCACTRLPERICHAAVMHREPICAQYHLRFCLHCRSCQPCREADAAQGSVCHIAIHIGSSCRTRSVWRRCGMRRTTWLLPTSPSCCAATSLP